MAERCPNCAYTGDGKDFEGWEARDGHASPVFTLRCPKCEALLATTAPASAEDPSAEVT